MNHLILFPTLHVGEELITQMCLNKRMVVFCKEEQYDLFGHLTQWISWIKVKWVKSIIGLNYLVTSQLSENA